MGVGNAKGAGESSPWMKLDIVTVGDNLLLSDREKINGVLKQIIDQRTDEWGGSPENRRRFVLELVREAVGKVNADLASDPKLANTQIRRFIVLHKELDADDDELTRTRKVRRGFIQQKFKQLVDAMYGGAKEQYVETAVRFEDGRTGTIRATLKIIDAEVFSALRKAA